MKTIKIPFIIFAYLGSLTLNAQTPSQTDWQNALSWAGDSSSRYGYMEDLSQAYAKATGQHIALTSEGSIDGISMVKSSQADMGGAGRYATEDEEDHKSLTMRPIVWDALVVVVNPENPIQNISLEQLRNIFTGKLDNWSQLGGSDEPIELHTRNNRLSGVGFTIRKLLFANFNANFKEAERYKLKSSDPLEISIERNPLGIGVTGISSAKKKNLKILTVDGVKPTTENIQKGEYFFYRPLYLTYNPQNEKKAEIERFIKFTYSKKGREIIRKSGSVPYIDALTLVMKQIDQERDAVKRGLYDN